MFHCSQVLLVSVAMTVAFGSSASASTIIPENRFIGAADASGPAPNGSVSSGSSTLYSNGNPNQVDGTDISSFVSADDFKLTTAVNLTGVTFFASADSDPFTSQFSGAIGFGIFVDSKGQPGILVASGSNNSPVLLDTGKQILGTEEYQLAIAVPSVSLTAGTYWLGLHEGPFGTPYDGTTIYWDTTATQTGSLPMATSDLTGASGWFPSLSETNMDLAFSLQGSSAASTPTPEPAQWLAVLLAIAGCIISREVLRCRRQ